MVEWITGLTMQDYVRRHFGSTRDARSQETLVAATRTAIARYLGDGSTALAQPSQDAAPHLSLSLKGMIEQRFFPQAAGQLEQLMKHTPAILTLRVEAPWQIDQKKLDMLLSGLKRYGDRVFIVVDEHIRHLVTVDSSVFYLVLGRSR